MNAIPRTFDLLRKVLLLALLGFLVVTFSGVIATVLGFALVGLLVWSVVQVVIKGPRAAWEGLGPALRGALQIPVRMGRILLVAPVSCAYHAGRSVVRMVAHGAATVLRKIWSLASGSLGLALEIVSGVLLGAMLGALYEGKADIRILGILFGALCGASLGALIIASRRKRVTKVVA
jgi:hypothetical protein